MSVAETPEAPVRAKAILVDPVTMTALWANDAARQDIPAGTDPAGLPLAEAIPLAETLGLPDAIHAAAETGEPQERGTRLVTTSRGAVVIAAAASLLPDGLVLVIIENTWEPRKRTSVDDDTPPRKGAWARRYR